MDKILPNLYLGSIRWVVEPTLISENKIQYILSITDSPRYQRKIQMMADKLEIPNTMVSLEDLPGENILRTIETTNQLIHDAISAEKNILVHCDAGVSRSASIVIAYIMKAVKLNYSEALQFVKCRRDCVNPNHGFVAQLLSIRY